MEMPLLWHIPLSHYNEKVRWALDHKRIAHHRQVLGPNYLFGAWRATGHGTLPILWLDGRAIGDSTRIIAALEARYPEPALIPLMPPPGSARSHWKTILTSSSALRCGRPLSRRYFGTIQTSRCAS
jgi:glutathione S-transferase